MKEYISMIIYVCIFSVILEIILPNNKLRKYIITIASLIIILVIISPVVNVIKNKEVTEVISKTIENISSSNYETKNPYDFSNYQDKVVFSGVKTKLQEEIFNSLKSKFKDISDIQDVEIILNKQYEIDVVKVTSKSISLVTTANSIISYLQSEYNIPQDKIEVINKGD